MNAKPAVFSFESNTQIRAITINGSPWFVAIDVCNALGLTNNRDALLKLDDDEKDTVGLTDSQPGMGPQSISIISESGLYTLILRCRDAVRKGTIPYRFRKWVTSEVLPQIRRTGSYSKPVQEQLPEVSSSLSVRDGRRSKKETDRKAAERIAEKCVPMILREMRDYQYHYSNCEIGPDEVLPALLSEEREGLQLHALLRELGSNNHEVAGAYRELEVIRYCLLQQRKAIGDMLTHAEYIIKQAKSH
ncbi:Bro-N domain-containing protein [Cedecea davisae]|uniref:BRO-N domain-containing protein n=1 Tax=Cedecea davisae TaxID=158484 RepID=UPI00376EA6F7